MITNNHQNKILVKLTPDDTFIALQTYDVVHGKSSHFYLCRTLIRRWFEEETSTSFLDTDLQNTVKLTIIGDEIYTVVNWLNVSSTGNISGYQQTFYIPIGTLYRAIEGESCKLIIHTQTDSKAQIRLSASGSNRLRSLNKLQRRAFSKALRENFHWKDSHVTLSADYGKDFFFRDEAMCGGLCLHEYTFHGKDEQNHNGYYYSIHT